MERNPEVARYAKEELNEVNRNHTPWVNFWMAFGVVLYCVYLYTGIGNFLPWAALSAVCGVFGNMIRAAAQVKRQWALHTEHMPAGIRLQPDSRSKADLTAGNVIGLILLLVLLVVVNYESPEKLTGLHPYVLVLADLIAVIGTVCYIRAEMHTPTFRV